MATTPMEYAATKLGKGEVPDQADLQKYLATGGADLDPKTTAWCAAFVNSSLAQAGIKGTGSNMARSFMGWGEGVKEPQKGDLAVFSRGNPNGPYGHVGFFDSYAPDGSIRVLGGNQGNAVSLASYPSDRLLGYRRATSGGPTVAQQVASNQTAPVNVAPGEAAPSLPAPINVGDHPVSPVMGSMSPAPQQSAPVPDAVIAAAQPTPTDKMGSMFNAMLMQPPQQPQMQPVNIQGPSPEQANALSSLIAALKQQRMV